MKLTNVDYEALLRLQNKDSTQADLLRALLAQSGESYILTRIRTLEARGFIKKERRDNSNTRYVSITQAGRDILATIAGDKPRGPGPAPSPGAAV